MKNLLPFTGLLLSITHLLCGDPEFRLTAETEPLAAVHNCVNAISGDFFYIKTDVDMPGGESLRYSICYDSGHVYSSPKGFGIGSQFSTHARSISHRPLEDSSSMKLQEREGSFLKYLKTSDQPNFTIDSEIFNLGFTNFSRKGVSAHTNIRNRRVEVSASPRSLVVTEGCGTQRIYHPYTLKKEEEWRITKEIHPNGHKYLFEYDDPKLPSRIISCNHDESTIYSFIEFTYDPDGYSIKTSRGDEIRYNLTPVHVHHHQYNRYGKDLDFWTKRNHLTSVISSRGIDTTYEISASPKIGISRQITCISKPDGRYLRIYYGKGTNAGKVMGLYAPLGRDSTPIQLARFSYFNNVTFVTDAYRNMTAYRLKNSRITAIEKYLGRKVYSTRRYLWSDGPDKGSLLARGLSDSQGKFAETIVATYDDRGNIIEEQCYGNLTGLHPDSFTADASFRPTEPTDCCKTQFEYSQDGLNLLLSERYPDGKVIHYKYLPGTNLQTERLICEGAAILHRQSCDYDDGLLCLTIDDDGVNKKIKRIAYNAFGLPECTTEAYEENGQEIQLKKTVKTYDAFGQLLQEDVYDSNNLLNHSLYYTYDHKGNLVSETDPIGRLTKYAYDANKNKIYEEVVGSGYHTTYSYDFCNRLIQESQHHDDTILTTTYTYDYRGNLTSMVDAFNQETRYEYDGFSREIRRIYPACVAEDGAIYQPTETMEYDIFGNVTRQTDAMGHSTVTRYNIRKQPISIQYPDGTQERFEYNLNGTLAKKWDAAGLCTTYTYDVLKREIKSECSSKCVKHIYEGDNLAAVIDAEGNETQFFYDAAGRKIEERTADSSTCFAYDSMGRLCATIDNAAHIEVFDALDRVIEKRTENLQGILQRKECFEYDINGNVVLHKVFIDEHASADTHKVYDTRSRLTRVTDPLGNITSFHHFERYPNPAKGNSYLLSTTSTDPANGQTIEVYDSHQRLSSIEKRCPDGHRISFQRCHYDPCGRKTAQFDDIIASNVTTGRYVIRWQYDSMDNIIQLTEQDRKITSYKYELGKLKTKIKPDGVSLDYTYDIYGRVKTLASSDGSIAYEYIYDNNDNVIEARDLISRTATKRTYNSNQLLVSETLANGQKIDYQYHNGQLARTLFQDGTSVVYRYDGDNLISLSRVDGQQNVLYSHHYSNYDFRGLCQQTLNPSGESAASFDSLGRVVHIMAPNWSQEITYDTVGNPTEITIQTSEEVLSKQLRYDPLHQLTHEGDDYVYENDSIHNRLSKNGLNQPVDSLNQLKAFEHDLNGNIIKAEHHHQYDALDRLVRVEAAEWNVDYSYDVFGRQLSRGYQDSLTTQNNHYLFHFDTEIGTEAERRIIAKNLTVAIEKDGIPYFPVLDFQGNLCCLNDAFGNAVEYIQYSAYGEINTTPAYSPWGFSGKRWDEKTKLWDFGKRHLNPLTGRWMTPDPAGFVDGCNLYTYLLNQPFRYTDPDGQAVWMIALPLFTWGGAAGFSWVVPSLYTILVPAVVYCSFEAACRYIDRMEESPFDFMSNEYTDEERDQIDDLEDKLSKPRPKKRDKNKPDLAPSNHQNKQFDDAMETIGRRDGKPVSEEKKESIHRAITKKGYTYQDILDEF